jgi:hypothetical protein
MTATLIGGRRKTKKHVLRKRKLTKNKRKLVKSHKKMNKRKTRRNRSKKNRKMMGGSACNCNASPLEGSVWDATNGGTHYELNEIKGVDTPRILTGGKKGGKKGGRKQKGGQQYTGHNLLAQDFVNVGRDMGYATGSAYNTFMGFPQPINPSPTSQPYLEDISDSRYELL